MDNIESNDGIARDLENLKKTVKEIVTAWDENVFIKTHLFFDLIFKTKNKETKVLEISTRLNEFL
jgi:6-pyruvoyl-tetrahydropterin synthase